MTKTINMNIADMASVVQGEQPSCKAVQCRDVSEALIRFQGKSTSLENGMCVIRMILVRSGAYHWTDCQVTRKGLIDVQLGVGLSEEYKFNNQTTNIAPYIPKLINRVKKTASFGARSNSTRCPRRSDLTFPALKLHATSLTGPLNPSRHVYLRMIPMEFESRSYKTHGFFFTFNANSFSKRSHVATFSTACMPSLAGTQRLRIEQISSPQRYICLLGWQLPKSDEFARRQMSGTQQKVRPRWNDDLAGAQATREQVPHSFEFNPERAIIQASVYPVHPLIQ